MLNIRIKALREALDFTQDKFASELGLSKRVVQRWEYAETNLTEYYLRLIQFTFDVNPEWLREGKGEMFKPALIPNAEKLMAWLKSLPEDDQTWAIKEFERHVPEFKKWLKK